MLTTVFLKLSASGNGDAPMRTAGDEAREALPLLLLLLFGVANGVEVTYIAAKRQHVVVSM